MEEIKDLIKKDLEEEFTPKFQGLNKGLGIAPAGGSGGGKPPRPPMPPTAPKPPATPGTKKPAMNRPKATTAPKAPMAPKAPAASGMKSVGKPAMPNGNGMHKQAPKENGQKDRRKEDRYHIHQNGHRLTEGHETVTLNEIKQKHGSVQNFESKGFRLVQSKPSDYKKNEEIFSEVMGGYKPKFLDIKELAKTEPKAALTAISSEDLAKAGTQHVIAGVHIPNKVAPPPKSKKLPKSDKGSGGQISIGKDEIPANKVIQPIDRAEALRKLSQHKGNARNKNFKDYMQRRSGAKPVVDPPTEAEIDEKDKILANKD